MDKKIILIVLIVFIFGLVMGGGIAWIVSRNENSNLEVLEIEEVSEDAIATNIEEEKVGVNAIVTLKHEYLVCRHVESEVLENVIVNKTKEEVEKIYKDYEIEKFSSSEVILVNKQNIMCSNHFVVKLENGVITVFEEDGYGQLSLYEKTGIYEEYLTEADKEELRSGISIFGKEKLNIILEDYH